MGTPEDVEETPAGTASDAGLARNAGILALGSATSRLLGLAREVVIAAFFGATGEVSAFRVASQVPLMLYDFLIGGMLSAALVPVLSEYAQVRRGTAFRHLVVVLFTLAGCALALLALLLAVAAPQLAWLLAAGFVEVDPDLLALTVRLIRLSAPAVWLFGMAGLLTAVLYALRRFSFPALATAIYNLGIVVGAPLLAERMGIVSLVVGILAGASAQVVVLVWDLRRAGLQIQWRPIWSHPAVSRILRLYAPIAAGLVVSLFQIGLDRRLASSTGAQSIAWMSNATTLQQMPLGLISVAISLAALPRLSQFYALGDEAGYRQTLGRGLRMVLLLIAPAAVFLWVVGEPVVRLLFERGEFTAGDTLHVVWALRIYLIGMLFAAVDFPLNFAFYARGNTWLPALVGVLSVGVYMGVALATVQPLGYLGLVWADTAKQASHALAMGLLLAWKVGQLPARFGRGVATVSGAAAAMAVVSGALALGLRDGLPEGPMLDLALLVVAGGGGLATYVGVLSRTQMPELQAVGQALRQRWPARLQPRQP